MVALAADRAFSAERPILLPLHSLGLLDLPLGTAHTIHESIYDNTLCPHLHLPQWRRHRQVSSSSSSTSSLTSTSTSRSSSPTLFDVSSPSSRASTPSTEPDTSSSFTLTSTSPSVPAPPTPILSVSPLAARLPAQSDVPPVRFRLEPCTLAEAQAIVLVPPLSAPFIPSSSTPKLPQKQQALLLLGHSLEYLRQPNRQLAKGARIHPYRITPSRRKDVNVHIRRSVLAALPKSTTL